VDDSQSRIEEGETVKYEDQVKIKSDETPKKKKKKKNKKHHDKENMRDKYIGKEWWKGEQQAETVKEIITGSGRGQECYEWIAGFLFFSSFAQHHTAVIYIEELLWYTVRACLWFANFAKERFYEQNWRALLEKILFLFFILLNFFRWIKALINTRTFLPALLYIKITRYRIPLKMPMRKKHSVSN